MIVGGGDGGVAREVAKHPQVERIVQVEIDPKVLEVSKKYLPSMGVGLDHPKVTLNIGLTLHLRIGKKEKKEKNNRINPDKSNNEDRLEFQSPSSRSIVDRVGIASSASGIRRRE